MNKGQRSELSDLISVFTALLQDKSTTLDMLSREADKAVDSIEQMADDEQEKIDNLPENLMYSTRADEFQENVDTLYDAMECFGGVSDSESKMEAVRAVQDGIKGLQNLL